MFVLIYVVNQALLSKLLLYVFNCDLYSTLKKQILRFQNCAMYSGGKCFINNIESGNRPYINNIYCCNSKNAILSVYNALYYR